MKKEVILFNLLFLIGCFGFYACNSNVPKNEPSSDREEKIYPQLFLLSKGLVNDNLKTEFLKFIKKDPSLENVAIIVNATKSESKKIKKTKKVKMRFAALGFDTAKIELFDLLKRNPQELKEFNIIYILGGNPFLLLNEVRKSNTDAVLKEIAFQDKILMGYSAGALLLGPNLNLMNNVDSLLGFNEIKLTNLLCLGLYDFLIFPHFKDFTEQVEGLSEQILKYESQTHHKIYRLNDNQGISYRNGKIKIIGN